MEITNDPDKIIVGDEKFYQNILNVAVEIGSAILSYGGSVSRVETAVERICSSYACAEVNVFAIPSMIIVCIKLADGTELSQMKRIYSISNNIAMLEKYNQLSRDICTNVYPVAVADQKLKELKSCVPSNRKLTVLGSAIAAGAFAVYFGGTLIDFIPAFFIGALMSFLNGVFSSRAFNGYANAFTLSVIGGTLSVLFCWLLNLLGFNCNTDTVMIGTIMTVIPGLLICNAVRDLFTGDLLSGALQILNGILITLAIAAGYAISLYVFKNLVSVVEIIPREGLEYYVYFVISGMIGAFGVSVWFNLSSKRYGWAMLTTFASLGVYLLMQHLANVDPFVINLVTTVFATAVSETLARTVKCPSTVFLIPAIIPFVPGSSLYYTMSYVVSGNGELASAYGANTGLIFLGIAIGLSMVTLLFQLFFPVKNKINLKHKLRFTHIKK